MLSHQGKVDLNKFVISAEAKNLQKDKARGEFEKSLKHRRDDVISEIRDRNSGIDLEPGSLEGSLQVCLVILS